MTESYAARGSGSITVWARMSRRHPESAIHRAVVQHLRTRGVPGMVWWHTPQGAYYGSKAQGAIMKAMGTLPGVSDLLLFHKNQLYALELKAKGGRASEAQLKFISDIDRAGAYTALAEGLDAALATLEAWSLLRPSVPSVRDVLRNVESVA